MTNVTDQLKVSLVDRYLIESELGEGGMATVYLAHDVKHDRKVALKVLRPELAAVIGAERFLQEIKVTANLQHPHILPLHDSGAADSFLYYVMPFVDGETLRDKLNREKQLAIDEAVKICDSVSAALDYAHRQNVIHRDIKPENILLHDGQALVADFGIALAVSQAGTNRITETGLSIGTPHYMSPEQAMGDRELDARSDIYSLGAMLYEMLAGDPPYQGSTAQAIVAKVITEKAPPVTAVRDTVPNNIAAAITKALAKLPADRFHTAAEFASALSNPVFALPTAAPLVEAESRASVSPARRYAWPAVAVALLALGLWGWLKPSATPAVSRYGLSLPVDQQYVDVFAPALAFSPDGGSLVYLGPENQLWIKRRDQYEAAPLSGTEGARAPIFSPDGDWVAFVAGTELRRVPAVGGSPTVLTDSLEAGVRSVTWQDDGTIVVTARGFVLGRVPDIGGPMEIVHAPEDGLAAMQPSALPGSQALLFKTCDGGCQTVSELWVLEYDSQEARMLFPGVAQAWHVPTGHIVYVRQDGAMFGIPFDLGSLEVSGAPVPLLDGVQVAGGIVPDLALSPAGDLIMVAGSAGQAGLGMAEPVWVDRGGNATLVDEKWTLNPGANRGWAISPDGTKLATKNLTEAGDDIWVKDLDDGPFTRLTFDAATEERPRWTPDGRSIMFLSTREDGGRNLFVRRADGTGTVEVVLDLEPEILEAQYSHDAEWILFRTAGTVGGSGERDIWAIRPGVDSVPVPLLQEAYDEKAPAISPDGRWLAYESNQTGRNEIFVRPFPDVDSGQWQVSTDGGRMPLWSRAGGELFYMNGDGELIAARVVTEPTFSRGEHRALFQIGGEFLLSRNYTPFDIHPDGERFLMMRPIGTGDAAPLGQMIVVENWFEEVKQKMGN